MQRTQHKTKHASSSSSLTVPKRRQRMLLALLLWHIAFIDIHVNQQRALQREERTSCNIRQLFVETHNSIQVVCTCCGAETPAFTRKPKAKPPRALTERQAGRSKIQQSLGKDPTHTHKDIIRDPL
jgi:Uri superfamily endonuclease